MTLASIRGALRTQSTRLATVIKSRQANRATSWPDAKSSFREIADGALSATIKPGDTLSISAQSARFSWRLPITQSD